MNILSSLENLVRNIRNQLSLADPKSWDSRLWQLAGTQSLSGENVTEDNSRTYSAVWNAVELISSTIAALPLNLMQKKGSANRIADDRKLFRVMHSQWNPYMTAKRGRETQIAHTLLWGNGYAEIVRDGFGEVVELWPIHPRRVTPMMQSGELIYRIQMDREAPIMLPRDKVLHTLGPSDDGIIGLSRIAYARKGIGLAMAQETFGASFFGKGTNPSMVVLHPGQLKDPAEFRKALTEVYSGLGNTHRLMLLEDGMKVEKYGIPPNDCQFLESRQYSITEIARWFNLPPHKLKDLTRSSFSNIESEQRSFYTDTLLGSLVDLEQTYEMQLLTDGDRGMYGRGSLYFKHFTKGLLRADVTAQTAFYSAMLDRGVFSINDVRSLEDMDPINGGDIHLVPLNYQSLEFAGKPPEPKAPALPDVIPPGKGNGKDRTAALAIGGTEQ